jgi:hypothetical protein
MSQTMVATVESVPAPAGFRDMPSPRRRPRINPVTLARAAAYHRIAAALLVEAGLLGGVAFALVTPPESSGVAMATGLAAVALGAALALRSRALTMRAAGLMRAI